MYIHILACSLDLAIINEFIQPRLNELQRKLEYSFFYLFDLALAQDGKIIGTMHSHFRLKCTENFLEL